MALSLPSREQLSYPAPVGQRELRVELCQRLEGERPLHEPRVGNGKPRLLHDLVAVQKEVEVDRPWSESRPRPLPAELALHGEEPREELARPELGLDSHRTVQEAGLVEEADRFGLA